MKFKENNDRPAYLVAHPLLIFFNLGLVNHISGGQMRVGSYIEYDGEILYYIVNGYILETVKFIEIGSPNTYTKCYGQYIWYIRYGRWGYPNKEIIYLKNH